MPTNRASDAMKATYRQTWYSTISAALPAGAATDRLAARFQSFADTVQTRLDTANGTGTTLTGSLEAQVDRALSQVLRQPSAGGAGPAAGPGTTQLVTQALSVATLLNGSGGPPAIAPRQAALLQEATLIKGDLLSVLDSLQPLSAFPDPSDIAAVTAIVRSEVSMLIEEFSRTTLRPRAQRVRVLLGGLLGWDPINHPAPNLGDVNALLTLLNLGGPLVPTLQLEQQLAGQDVLGGDAQGLLNQWLGFQATDPATIPLPWEAGLGLRLPILSGLGHLGPQPGVGTPLALGPASVQALFRLAVIGSGGGPPQGSYAERLIQADLLLPVVGQDASRVAGALTAIGLSPGEQETTFIDLQSLVDMDILSGGIPAPLAPPPAGSFVPVHTTITDVLDWSAGMADATVTDLVRQAGQLGLNLIADQADELFWLVAAMLYPGVAAQMAELGDAQVQTELLTLARDLNLLANLAV
jgi:hypothetical protein